MNNSYKYIITDKYVIATIIYKGQRYNGKVKRLDSMPIDYAKLIAAARCSLKIQLRRKNYENTHKNTDQT